MNIKLLNPQPKTLNPAGDMVGASSSVWNGIHLPWDPFWRKQRSQKNECTNYT